MKRIVILCDGTWNRSDSETPTNVVRFAQAMAAAGADGAAQVPVYLRGVGTGGPLDTIAGGAFGVGLMDNVAEAYRQLVFLYEPGDEVFVLGFSRGAYTARSLTGFIRSTGMLDRAALHRVPDAVARYRTMDDPRTHPSSKESHAWRADVSTRVVTSPKEAAWRAARGLPGAPLFRVAYLGVWDSVGALGVPAHVPVLGRIAARRYRFHDAALSSMVRSARHAVALDERRRTFPPTRWSNVGELNARADDPGARPYRELFFAGDHGSVGGGGDVTALSSIGLDWVAEGAAEAGLAFDPGALEAVRAERDPMGPLSNTSRPPTGLMDRLMRSRPVDREGPARLEELHSSAIARWSAEAKSEGFVPYRPGSLARIGTELAEHRDRAVFGEGGTRVA